MAGLVRVTPEELRGVAGATRTDNGELESACNAINSELAAFHSFFQGRAAEAFGSTLQGWYESAKAISQSLNGLAEYLDGAAKAFESTDTGLSGALGGAGGGGGGGTGGTGAGGGSQYEPMPASPVAPMPSPGAPIRGAEPMPDPITITDPVRPGPWRPDPVTPLPVDPIDPVDQFPDLEPGEQVIDYDGDGNPDFIIRPIDPSVPIEPLPHQEPPWMDTMPIAPLPGGDGVWIDTMPVETLPHQELPRIDALPLDTLPHAVIEDPSAMLERRQQFLERRMEWANEQVSTLEALDHVDTSALDEARETLSRLHERQAELAQRIQERVAQSVVQMS